MNTKIVSLLFIALLAGSVFCELEDAVDIQETIELVARHPGHDTPESNTPTTRPSSSSPTRRPQTPATQAPTRRPNRPATQAPTRRPQTPVTQAPTRRPQTPVTQAPTRRPQTPVTQAPTRTPQNPATQAPATPTRTPAPPSTDLCALTSTSAEPLKLLVPLYVYPGAQWDKLVAAAATGVEIIAIINPNSGPASKADSAYITYMKKLTAAGIDMVGYVHTTYGDRSINDVKNDINTYATQYPGLKGIFIDEASSSAGDLSYYTQVYQAITSKSGYTNVILNPGTQPDKGYLTISTNIVVFENAGSNFARTSLPSWVKCASSSAQKSGYTYRFGSIAYGISQSAMPALISSMRNAGIGLVYVTDGAGGCCTYNNLVSYIAAEASAVNALN